MTRRVGTTALVAALLLAALAAWLTWRDSVVVEDRLGAAREALVASRAELADRDLEAARDALLKARDAAEQVPGRLDGPVWAAVSLVPPIGDAPELARAAADLASTGAALGLAAVEDAEVVLGGDALSNLVRAGGVDIEQLEQVADDVAALPVEAVADATDRLRATDPDRITPGLRSERQAAIGLAEELLEQFSTARAALEAGLDVLGADEPRTYLVAAQNPSELRGTGGLIGYLTEVTFDRGDIRVGQGAGVDAETALRRRGLESTSVAELPPPVERPDQFAERYDHAAAGQFIGSVNLDPDLPTVSPVLLRLYEEQTGRTADGVLLLDPVALGRIVAVTGEPLVLPDDLELGTLPRQVWGGALAELIMVEGYDVLGGGTEEKQAFDEAVIDAALARLVGGGWDAAAMLDELGELVDERRLQAWSANETTQQTLVTTGAAGLVTRPESGRDLLAVTANNAAANKADVHVEHHISGRIMLQDVDDELATAAAPVVERDAAVEVAVANPLEPEDHVDYITGSDELVPFGSGRPERTRNALVRTWFSVWTPDATRPTSATDSVNDRALRVDEIHGHRVYDYYLETPSQRTTAFGLGYTSPVQLKRDGDELVYELELWRQGKAIVDQWDLQVTAPSGWTVREATVEGGGEPTGLGPRAASAQQLSAIVTDAGAARLEGAAVTDAVLQVVMARHSASGDGGADVTQRETAIGDISSSSQLPAVLHRTAPSA